MPTTRSSCSFRTRASSNTGTRPWASDLWPVAYALQGCAGIALVGESTSPNSRLGTGRKDHRRSPRLPRRPHWSARLLARKACSRLHQSWLPRPTTARHLTKPDPTQHVAFPSSTAHPHGRSCLPPDPHISRMGERSTSPSLDVRHTASEARSRSRKPAGVRKSRKSRAAGT
jgi:hypothetical protein